MSEERSEYTQAAHRILELLPPLRNWVTARVQQTGADRGVSLRQYAALRGIQDGANSPGELARLWQVTPAVITGVVDRLERRGLVRREIDPRDRRRLLLALTAAGHAASEEVEAALIEDLAAQLTLATPEELTELGRSLDLLQRTFAALVASTPAIVQPRGEDENPLWIDQDDDVDPLPDRREDRDRGGALVGARG